MFRSDRKCYSLDRYIPTRGLIDFDEAFFKICTHLEEPQDSFSRSFSAHRHLEMRRRLENLAKIKQRIFNISPFNPSLKEQSPTIRLWPCRPRKKPVLRNIKILDLPDFNSGFHLNTIDWGSNDLIATCLCNRVLVGGGTHDQEDTHLITEYENDRGTSVHWSPDGLNLAVGTESGFIQFWKMTKNEVLLEIKCCIGENCIITSLQWHPSGECIAWGCGRGKMCIRSFNKRKTHLNIEHAHEGYICNLKYSPKADYLCSSGNDGFVRIWKGSTYEPYLEIEMSNPVRAIAWHPWKSGLLAVGEGPPGPGSLSIWNINTGKLLHMKKSERPNGIEALEFNPITGELVCSQLIFSNLHECDGRAEILVLGGPEYVVDSITELTGNAISLLWSPDGTQLGTVCTDESLKIWTFYHSQGKKRSLDKSDQDLGLLALKKFKCTLR